MTSREISLKRLHSQQLSQTEFDSPLAVVSHFGAMQAQDFPMSKWAVGVRTKTCSEADIDRALDEGEILRTHILRPTWHLVAASDIHWMLELTAKNVLRQMNSSNRQLGLDDKIFNRCNDLIARALEGGKQLTRSELMTELSHNGVNTEGLRNLHIMFKAELDGIVCSGKRKGSDHTYALLSERVPKPGLLSKEESLKELALRYFTSHGPASLKDFIWWSGLSVTDAKLAVKLNSDRLCENIFGEVSLFFAGEYDAKPKSGVLLLPSFDEFLIAYKDRSASIDEKNSPAAFTKNGIFRPIIVENGKVTGVWTRVIKKDTVEAELQFFVAPKTISKSIQAAAEKYASFIGKKLKLTYA